MYQSVFSSNFERINLARTIRNPCDLKGIKPVVICRSALGKLKFPALPFCRVPEENRYRTTLRFPPEAAGEKERQVQKLNYDSFIHVMAEMVQKYAPEILG